MCLAKLNVRNYLDHFHQAGPCFERLFCDRNYQCGCLPCPDCTPAKQCGLMVGH